MRILFLSRWFPYPLDNGSKLRIYNLLRGLAKVHEVDLLSFSDTPVSEKDLSEVQKSCLKVKIIPWNQYNPKSTQARLGFIHSAPRYIVDTYSIKMAQSISECVSQKNYNLVIASQLDSAVYRKYFRELPALFEEVEVGVLFELSKNARTLYHRLRNKLTWEKHRRFLKNLLLEFKNCTVVSAQEKELVCREIIDTIKIDIIPNGVMLEEYNQINVSPQPRTLIFTGSFRYYVNYDAILWFLEHVFPLVLNEFPDVKLIITGDSAGLQLPSRTNVIQTGYVSDVRPYVASAWASVAPIFQGGGTRLKIIEAMALKTPVISTTKGAEGLGVHHGTELLIADKPEDFAGSIIKILTNPSLRQNLSTNAYKFVQQHLDWSVILPHFLDIVEQTAHENKRSSSDL